MGNLMSSPAKKNNDFKNFYEIVDYIATHYILTMDFESLSKLSQPEYCDKLVIITSDIIKKYFNDLEITYLAQRIRDGQEVNEMSKENVSFVNKDALETLDIKNDTNKSIKKKRVCIGIAKFYVKIAHIFAAILTTINPVYVYKDGLGNDIEKGLFEKGEIPAKSKRKVTKTNICDNRINRLKPLLKKTQSTDPNNLTNPNKSTDPNNSTDPNKSTDQNANIYVNPKICELNLNESGQPMLLSDEPGMSELMTLYLDDEYDYSNGKFTGMSDNMKSQFLRDLKIFYTTFTGNSTMPDDIKKFSDIKLRTYNLANGCQQDNILKAGHLMSQNDELFIKYAKNLKQMIYNAQSNQQKLLSIINELFVLVSEPYGENKKIRVNPKLTDTILQSLMDKTRNIIIQLYVTCEKDFEKGIHLYEAIVERKILETTKQQISNLLHKEQSILENSKNISLPPVVDLNNANSQENNSNISTIFSNTSLPKTNENNSYEPKQREVNSENIQPTITQEIKQLEMVQPTITQEIKPLEMVQPTITQEIKPLEMVQPTITQEIKPPEMVQPTITQEIKPPEMVQPTITQEIKPPEMVQPEIKPLELNTNSLIIKEPLKEEENQSSSLNTPVLPTVVPNVLNVPNVPNVPNNDVQKPVEKQNQLAPDIPLDVPPVVPNVLNNDVNNQVPPVVPNVLNNNVQKQVEGQNQNQVPTVVPNVSNIPNEGQNQVKAQQ